VTRRTLVICPAFEEEAAVGDVVRDIRTTLPAVDVVVVDDGSSDRTSEVAAAAGARVLRLPFNVGVGGALRTGLLLAAREGYDAVVQCDADGQHPVESIPDLVDALDSSDIVIGSRWADGTASYDARGPRRWAMKMLSAVMTRLHGHPLDDVTSGFRAFGPRAVAVLALELPPEYLADTVDALVIAKSHRLTVTQVPVTMRPRTTGVASHGPMRAAVFLSRACLVLVLSLARMWRGHKATPS